MKIGWITEYDMPTDKTYKCPGCLDCYAPIFRMHTGEFRCISCGGEADVDDEMKEFIDQRSGAKIETRDCPRCGGKLCFEELYHKNPVTLDWQLSCGKCRKCEIKIIV